MALRRPGVRIPLGPQEKASARVLFVIGLQGGAVGSYNLKGIEKAGGTRRASPWVHRKKHPQGCFLLSVYNAAQ